MAESTPSSSSGCSVSMSRPSLRLALRGSEAKNTATSDRVCRGSCWQLLVDSGYLTGSSWIAIWHLLEAHGADVAGREWVSHACHQVHAQSGQHVSTICMRQEQAAERALLTASPW